jgi:hypothetical protein
MDDARLSPTEQMVGGVVDDGHRLARKTLGLVGLPDADESECPRQAPREFVEPVRGVGG